MNVDKKPKFDILSVLEENFDKFTPTKKLLANYILSNSHEAAFLTADEMASKVNTTPSTVVRFAKEIGYTGYPEMQRDLQMLLINKISAIGQLKRAEQYSLPGLKNKIINLSILKDRENLDKLFSSLKTEDIKKFAKIVITSRRKYIVANRTAFSLGHFLFFELRKILPEVYLPTNVDGGIFEVLPGIGKDDVVVAVSFPRFARLTLTFAEYAHKKGVKVVSITHDRTSPLYSISEVSLFCPFDGVAFLESYVAPMALLNLVLSEVFYECHDNAVEKLKLHEEIMLGLKQVYLK
ncbi:MAG: MurR/RpiR family transcriptional regulator [Synergistetes bacterium]|nr:MurR/RpiR family transcriptional regulator [Synergistota bacterium]